MGRCDLVVMKWAGWSWAEYLETPQSRVDAAWDLIAAEVEAAEAI